MKKHVFQLVLLGVTAALVLGQTACSKSESDAEQASREPAAEMETEQETEQESVAAETLVGGGGPEPTYETPSNVQGTIAEADAAIRARNYQLAADSLIKMQLSGAVQNDQQAWDYNRRMTILQGQLAEAAANGDPRAQATIDFLKRTQRRGP